MPIFGGIHTKHQSANGNQGLQLGPGPTGDESGGIPERAWKIFKTPQKQRQPLGSSVKINKAEESSAQRKRRFLYHPPCNLGRILHSQSGTPKLTSIVHCADEPLPLMSITAVTGDG